MTFVVEGLPEHGKPFLEIGSLTHPQIAAAIAKLHTLRAATAQGVGCELKAWLKVEQRKCALTGDSIRGWYLIETADGQSGTRKLFYLLPLSQSDWDRQGGDFPAVEFSDAAFFVGATPQEQETAYLYIMHTLLSVLNR